MTRLSKRINELTIRGRTVPAVVIDVFFDKATVKLGENGAGAVQRGLPFVGGPPEVGQIVDVDYTTPVPHLIMRGKEWLTEDDLRNAIADIEGGLDGEFTYPIILFSGGALADTYPASAEGFTSALSDANSGDVISVQDFDIEGEFTIPDGVAITGISSRQSIIRGKVTLGSGSVLEQLSVLYGEYNGGEVVAIDVPSNTETSFIRRCEVHGYNCDGGSAVAIDIASGGELVVEYSTVIGDSATGQAWAIRGVAGADCKMLHGFIYGKTAQYTGLGLSEFSNTEAATEITRGCALPDSASLSAFASGNVLQQIPEFYAPTDPSGMVSNPPSPITMHTITDPTNGNQYPPGVCRKGKYLYYLNGNNASQAIMTEYDTDADTDSTINITSGAPVQNHQICVVDDRIVLYRSNIVGKTFDIYIVDFNLNSAWLYYVIPNEVDPVYAGSTEGFCSPPASVMSLMDAAGDIWIIGFGQYYENDESFNTRNGAYVVAKNYTQDGPWIHSYDIFDADFYNSGTQYLFCPPVPVRNEKVVFPLTINSSGSQTPADECRWYIPVYDIAEETIDFIKWTRTTSYGFTTNVYYGGAAHDDGLAFLSAQYANDANNDVIVRVDPYEMSASNYYTIGTGDTSLMMVSKTNCYLVEYVSSTERQIYRLDGLGIAELEVYNPPTGGFYEIDGASKVIDDNERFWVYDAGNNKMLGVKVENIADVIEFSTAGVTPTSVSPNNTGVYLLNDMIVLMMKKTATNTIPFYLLKE